jgi:nucleotide-binding universal stress UspA family protein
MSSHGRTGLSRVFYGSVAAGVLHKIDRPLLLIRAEKD